MSKWKGFGGLKGPGAVAMAAAVAIATVVPGGAFTSASAQVPNPLTDGVSFKAFALALADEAVQDAVGMVSDQYAGLAPILETATGDPNYGSDILEGALGSVPSTVHSAVDAALDNALAQLPTQTGGNQTTNLPPIPDLSGLTPGETPQTPTVTNPTEVVNALLGLLNPAEVKALAALAAAEAAILAKIDDTKVRTVAALANVDLGAQEAYILAQIDAARAAVVQAFALIRAQIVAAFAAARTHIINDLTGVDFGDALDEVLATIAQIQTVLDQKLAELQGRIDQLNLGL